MNPDDEKKLTSATDPAATTSDSDGALTQAEVDAAGESDIARPGTTDVQAYIGRQLRAVYDDVVKQPIPDRFLALMKQLEEQDPQK